MLDLEVENFELEFSKTRARVSRVREYVARVFKNHESLVPSLGSGTLYPVLRRDRWSPYKPHTQTGTSSRIASVVGINSTMVRVYPKVYARHPTIYCNYEATRGSEPL